MSPTNLKTGETVKLSPEEIAAIVAANAPTAEEQAAAAREHQAMQEARGNPLPGPLSEVFASAPKTLLGQSLADIAGIHLAALTRIKSPFMQGLRVAMLISQAPDAEAKARLLERAAALECTAEDTATVMVIFTTPAEDVLRQMRSPHFGTEIADKALQLLVKLPPLADWDSVQSALAAHYSLCFCARLELEVPRRPGDAESFTASLTKIPEASGSSNLPGS